MISFSRGELHKVSGVPRQWPFPKPAISLPAFKLAIEKRNAAVRGHTSAPKVELPYSRQALRDHDISVECSPSSGHVGGGREESDCKDLMDEDADGREDGSEHGRDSQSGSPSDTDVIAKPSGSGDHGFKLDGGEEEIDQEDEVCERRNDRKRKRDDQIDDISNAGNDTGSEPMAVDGDDQPDKMEVDVKAVDRATKGIGMPEAGMGYDPVREAGEARPQREDTADTGSDLGLRGNNEGNNDRETDREKLITKMEAPATPPADFEEHACAKQVEENHHSQKQVAPLEASGIGMKANKREEVEAKLKELTAEKHRLVQMLKQILNSEEESKRRGQGMLQSPPSIGVLHAPVGATSGADLMAATSARPGSNGAGAAHIHASADREEGELEYVRTPSPASHSPPTSHTSVGPPSPSVGPVPGRQLHLCEGQGGSASGAYYTQGLGNAASGATITAGAISPGASCVGNVPPGFGGRAYPHMAMQQAAALHSQKAVVTAAEVGHSHVSPTHSGAGPTAGGSGATGRPLGLGGHGASAPPHNPHSHLQQGAAVVTPHSSAQQGLVSSSLLITPRASSGYHDKRLGNSPWTVQR